MTSNPSVPANPFYSASDTSDKILIDDSDGEGGWNSDDDCFDAETGWDSTDDEVEEANASDNLIKIIEGNWN